MRVQRMVRLGLWVMLLSGSAGSGVVSADRQPMPAHFRYRPGRLEAPRRIDVAALGIRPGSRRVLQDMPRRIDTASLGIRPGARPRFGGSIHRFQGFRSGLLPRLSSVSRTRRF